MHILACPPTPAAKIMGLLQDTGKIKWVEELEQNQKIASCCRHPENHTIEAWFSCEADRDKGVPDIYKFRCTCGLTHVKFCVGGGDERPFWEVH